MNIDKTSTAKQQKLQAITHGSAWILAQRVRLHDGSGNKASSSLLAAIVASLVLIGLQ